MWKASTNGKVKSEIVGKWFVSFTFGQDSCLISDFAKPNSNKAVLVQAFLRFEIVIFNNNFVFCMISSFRRMTRVADWILSREIIKNTNVFYPRMFKKVLEKLDKHLWRGIFCESCMITNHILLKTNHFLLEIWGRCWRWRCFLYCDKEGVAVSFEPSIMCRRHIIYQAFTYLK